MSGNGESMKDEERYKITNNEYADLLIEYNGDVNLFNNFPNATVNIIDRQFATVHVPLANITPSSIYKFGFISIPNCYQLMSSPGFELSGFELPENNRIGNVPNYDMKGQGVLVGFVDTGIDYNNLVFKNEDNTTRIQSIWDQTIDSETNYPKDFFYGTEFGKDQINQALSSENPLAVVPSIDDNGHGTMLAGIAAGSNIEDYGFMGVAPYAEFVIVKLKTAKQYLKDFYFIPEGAICYQENDIMFGVKYLLEVAKQLKRPISICIGLGSAQGAHAGRSILGGYFSTVGRTVGTAFVVSAGNEGNRGHHYYNELISTIKQDTVELNVGANETGFSMELWANSAHTFLVEIIAPTGEFIGQIEVSLGQTRTVQFPFEETTVFVDSQIKRLITGDQLILFRFQNPMAGIWRLELHTNGDLPFKFHIWLPTSEFITEGTFFIKPNPFTTITSAGNIAEPITVTAYNQENQNLYYYSGLGFTSLNKPKPDIAAPGVNIYSPTINNQFIKSSGTGVAAAHIAGVSALLLEWGILRGNLTSMNSVQIKRALILGAQRDPTLTYPNPEWGYGILDIHTTFDYMTTELL